MEALQSAVVLRLAGAPAVEPDGVGQPVLGERRLEDNLHLTAGGVEQALAAQQETGVRVDSPLTLPLQQELGPFLHRVRLLPRHDGP
jgi:hypothetical protein